MPSQRTTANRTGSSNIVPLSVLAGIGVVIAGWTFFDIWVDLFREGRPLWSTLVENTFSLSFSIGVPLLAWRLRKTYSTAQLWKTAKWTAAGCGGALFLAGVVIGIQDLQEGLRPRVLLIQIAAFGAAAGLLVGVVLSRLGRANEALQGEIRERKAAEEELSKQVQKTREKNRLLGLVKEVSSAANEAESFEEALQRALDEVCEQTGWPIGHVFLRAGEEAEEEQFVASGIWNRGSQGRFEAFKKETEQLAFGMGKGLPGQVLADGRSAWIEDVSGSSDFPQQKAAAEAGIQGAFAFPVLLEGKVVAVLEFFSDQVEAPGEEFLEAMETVGLQLGRVAEREKAREELRKLNDNLEERARERAQEARREQERLRSLLDSIPDEVWFCSREGEISLVNEAVAEEFGFESPEDACRPLKEVLLELDVYDPDGTPRPMKEAPLFRSLEGEVVEGEEELLFCPETGEKRHRQINSAPLRGPSGEIIGSVAVARDITEMKRTEERLRQRERDFTALVNNIPQLVWMAEPDGHIFWYNERWYEYTGTTLEEMEGWGWKKVHHPDYLDQVVEQYKEAIETEEPFEDTFPLRRQDGEYRWFLTRAMPIRDEKGQVIRWFGTNTDITDRLELEDQLKELNESLEARVEKRTRQVRELASQLTMAEQRERERIARLLHDDLQQKLYGTKLKMGPLRKALREGEQERGAKQVEAVEERLQEILRGLRELAVDLSPPVLEREGLTATLEWLESHMEKTKGLKVELEAEGEFQMERELRVLLFQVARELLTNVSEHAGVKEAEVQLREEDGTLVIEVVDEGRGFNAHLLEELGPEDGFGLTAARERIRQFGGDLEIESVPEEGTRVTVRLPIEEGPEKESREPGR